MDKSKKDISFNISELQEGAVQEKVDREVKRIVENIIDPNTEFKPKRKLTIDITFESDESRQVINTTAEVKTKLAPPVPVATTLLAGRNQNTGFIQAAELKSSIPGQTFFDPNDSRLKTDTGEEIDGLEDAVVDFKKRKLNKN